MKDIVEKLYDLVWSQNRIDLIETLVAPSYTIHSDPGDAWEGKTLTREEYAKRMSYSRVAFPDLKFTLHKIISENNLVAVIWSAQGHHNGDLAGLPATGKLVSFQGQTMYELENGLVRGHWQTIDRLGFISQFRPQS